MEKNLIPHLKLEIGLLIRYKKNIHLENVCFFKNFTLFGISSFINDLALFEITSTNSGS